MVLNTDHGGSQSIDQAEYGPSQGRHGYPAPNLRIRDFGIAPRGFQVLFAGLTLRFPKSLNTTRSVLGLSRPAHDSRSILSEANQAPVPPAWPECRDQSTPYLLERVADEGLPDEALSPIEGAARALRQDMLQALGGPEVASAAQRALLDAILPAHSSIDSVVAVEKSLDASLYLWSRGAHGAVGLAIETASSEWLVRKLLVELAPKE